MLKNHFLTAVLLVGTIANPLWAQKKEKKTRTPAALAVDQTFSVVAMGDMPYTLPADYGRFENLIQTVNKQDQAFNVFVGDIKSSSTPCTEAVYEKMHDYFNQFDKPLVYTPGDNEWTDCSKKEAGAYDPEDRLAAIRKMFFKDTLSFGIHKMQLQSQSKNAMFAKFVENKRWSLHNVAFATIHIVGSNNFFLPVSKNHNQEFFERDSANIVWLKEIFAEASVQNRAGLVIFIHGDMFDSRSDLGFKNFLDALRTQLLAYKKQVLLVNGDSHMFLVDKPIQKTAKSKNDAIPNFTRLQVFGENEMHAVKITINPNDPALFQIGQLIVPGNE